MSGHVRRAALAWLSLLGVSITIHPLGAQSRQATISGWVTTEATIPPGATPTAGAASLVRGMIHQPDADFRDGSIEFDLSPAGSAFAGVAFRMKSAADYEIIYFRPDSGRWVSVQYQPVYQGETTWQLYHGSGYQAGLPRTLSGPLHVRILISGSRADLYVGRDSVPVLRVLELKRPRATGGVGFWVAGGQSEGANAELRDLRVTSSSSFRLTPVSPETHAPEQLMRWRVSPRQPSPDAIQSPPVLPPVASEMHGWKVVDAEGSGLVNLTAAIGNSAGPQRVNVFGGAGWGMALAHVRITSSHAQTRRIFLSYSDGAGVYLNGERIFTGRNDADSRGPGYLGVVGPETEFVDLVLRAGDNDLVLAITDKAFGWGFRARLDSLDGLSVRP